MLHLKHLLGSLLRDVLVFPGVVCSAEPIILICMHADNYKAPKVKILQATQARAATFCACTRKHAQNSLVIRFGLL